MVFIKVSPLRKVVRFGSSGKLAPRFVGPLTIVERVGKMADRIKIPERLMGVHDIFHVSHLRKCLHDSMEVVEPSQLEEVEVEREASVHHIPTKIVGHDIKKLRNKEVPLVKVQWGDSIEDATWEAEEKIRNSYPHLFDSTS